MTHKKDVGQGLGERCGRRRRRRRRRGRAFANCA
jgi:hypothetical protein